MVLGLKTLTPPGVAEITVVVDTSKEPVDTVAPAKLVLAIP